MKIARPVECDRAVVRGSDFELRAIKWSNADDHPRRSARARRTIALGRGENIAIGGIGV